VERDFTATAPNELWLTDITEHPTAEGKLYLCAVKDVYSGRIVGYSMDSRMKSSLSTLGVESSLLLNAVAGPYGLLFWSYPLLKLRVLKRDSCCYTHFCVPPDSSSHLLE
jgi:transposase InsO family protein